MSQNSIISLQNVNIYQDATLILKNVNFEVGPSEFVFLIGKTGTGKSSLLKTLYGDLPLKEGLGLVADFNLKDLTWQKVPLLRRKIGIVFQDFRLLTDRNVYSNLEFVLKATGWKDAQQIKNKIETVLSKVGILHKSNKMPYELSGGEQQRVDIARALLNDPKLILADEPTGNLDPETTDEIMQLLVNICYEFHTSIVMATHDYRIIERYPARIVKVENGGLHEVAMNSVMS